MPGVVSAAVQDIRRVMAKSQRLIDSRRERLNRLRPRDVTIPASTLQLDPAATLASIGGCVISDNEIVKVLPRQSTRGVSCKN